MSEPIAGTNLTTVVEFNETALALSDLRSRYKGLVVDVQTPKGLKEAKTFTFELRTLRTTLEKKRKDLKAPIIERGKQLDDEAKRITAEIVALEEPIDVQIKAEEARIENARLAKLEDERVRIEGITSQIRALRDTAGTLVGKPSSIINGALNRLETTVINESEFAEYYAEACDAMDAAKARVRDLLHAQKAHEAEQARIKAEREELERMRAENERLQREADERRTADLQAASDRIAEQERLAQVERDRVAAAERAEREVERQAQEAALQAERDRQAAEQRKLDEQAAQLKRDQQAAKAEAEQVRLAGLGLREAAQALVDHCIEFAIPEGFAQLVDDLRAALANDAAQAKPARTKRTARA